MHPAPSRMNAAALVSICARHTDNNDSLAGLNPMAISRWGPDQHSTENTYGITMYVHTWVLSLIPFFGGIIAVDFKCQRPP